MRKGFLLFAIIVIICSAGIGRLLSQDARSAQAPTGHYIEESFNEAAELVKQNYVLDVDNETLTRSALTNALHTLDPHSNFFTRRDFQQLEQEQSSRFYGIGVSINRRNGRVYILSPTEGAPAEQAGLRYGDEIIAVDGEDATSWDTQQVQDKVRGPRGEVVAITVNRAGEAQPLTFKIKRDAVPFPSVRGSFLLRPGVGYVALVGGFNSTTEAELSEAIERLKQQGMRQLLVLDLRNNPGGLLDQAVGVSKKFLRSGQTIVSVRGRTFPAREWQSDNLAPEDIPLVVLINRGSASASEIVAGAIQDHDRGIVVGENSFGKGLVQSVFKAPFGTGLLLTTAKYYTPSGRSIQRDYSVSSYYAYFRPFRESDSPAPLPADRERLQTDNGRPVYGGGGITPDIEVKAAEIDEVRGRIFFGTFEFVRQVAAGQIKGLESYRVNRTRHNYILRGDEYPLTEKVIAAYREFIARDDRFQLSEKQFTEHLNYIQNRIREELITTAYGPENGQLIQLQLDPQLQKALEVLPQARQLAENLDLRGRK